MLVSAIPSLLVYPYLPFLALIALYQVLHRGAEDVAGLDGQGLFCRPRLR